MLDAPEYKLIQGPSHELVSRNSKKRERFPDTNEIVTIKNSEMSLSLLLLLLLLFLFCGTRTKS